jgi:DNA invertase Pin-like site-specific DNA recombinase
VSRIVGYARVLAGEKNRSTQESELSAAGAEEIFVDLGESIRFKDRPQWLACLDFIRAGDTVLVHRLDRVGDSERMIIDTLNDLDRRGVNIKSATEPVIDTTTPHGRTLFGIVAVLAQVRVNIAREQTMRGLEIARSEGRVGGRPSVISPERLAEARRMRAMGYSIERIARVLGVGSSSVSRAFMKVDHAEAAPARARRVFFRDTKPYDVPASLDELLGPIGGILELPHAVYWGPERSVHLDTPSGIRKAYQAVLREGTVDDQRLILNREVLQSEWEELALPDRVRLMWESRFPELASPVLA